jgi:hypothetical protein
MDNQFLNNDNLMNSLKTHNDNPFTMNNNPFTMNNNPFTMNNKTIDLENILNIPSINDSIEKRLKGQLNRKKIVLNNDETPTIEEIHIEIFKKPKKDNKSPIKPNQKKPNQKKPNQKKQNTKKTKKTRKTRNQIKINDLKTLNIFISSSE